MGRRRLLLVLAAAVAPASALVAPQIATRKISDRRSLLSDVLASTAALTVTACTCTSTQPALAVAPFAPIDALLPAARVKLTLDQAVAIASKIDAEDAKAKNQRLGELEGLLLAPQNYTRGTTQMEVPQRPAQSYLDAYADYRNKVSLLEKPGAMLVQNGEIDAWKRLKRQERAREETDEIRAALNYYTSNLNFDADKFVLTASKEERSKLIREDRVPDVKSVIASDMGLRYLLRNDLLTAVDDARAELRYQIKQSNEGAGVEGKELLELLVAAEGACDGWFGLIGETDRETALALVRQEK
ncbi:hypothetical protein ACHAXT_006513 [Thalassiosira profunda]